MGRLFLIGTALAILFAGQSVLAQPGRSVPTESIIVPEEERSRDMPAIDIDAPDELAIPPFSSTDLPDVIYDASTLPPPVKRLREQIIAAAATGNLDNLTPIIEANGRPPALSFGHVEDPIAYLRSLSGDSEGREILAILIEVLEAGFVRAEVGTPDEIYVWPYFARYPVSALSAEQIVELFKLVYAGDYEDMLAYGYYLSYRVGIAPDGTWRFFIAGD
jgi:hypothetical protein